MYRPSYVCRCPFYENEYRKGICCEGIGEASSTTMNFEDENKKNEYIKQYCINEYPEECKIFQILAQKWGAD